MELKNVDIFSELDEKELAKIRKIIHEKEYGEKEIIFKENEPGGRMCVILKGAVEIKKSIMGQNGLQQNITLARFTPPELFGELSIFDDRPRSAVVESITKTAVAEISRADLYKLLEDDPKLGVKLLKAIIMKTAKRLCVADDTIRDLAKNIYHV